MPKLGFVFKPKASVSDIVIADRISDRNQIRLRGTTGLQVSWELSYAGQLSCEVPWRDLRRYGFTNPFQLKGKWLHYEHPTAGAWGGIITNASGSDGVVSINGETWASALKGITTRRSASDSYGLVAELRRQIDLAKVDSGISPGYFAIGGPDIAVTGEPVDDGQDLYESFLPSVMERWEDTNGWRTGTLQAAGWNVDPLTRVFNFDDSYGVDRSWYVGLLDGRHNTHAEFADDILDVVNRVHLSGTVNYRYTETIKYRGNKGQRKTRTIVHTGAARHNAVATNLASTAQYGVRTLPMQEDHPSAAAMDREAVSRVTFLARQERPVTVECADEGRVWAKFREGDIIAVDMALTGARGKMVVRHRALDVARGVMTVSGEAELG